MSDIAERDANFVPALQGVSSLDGTTLIDIWVDPTTHGILIDGTSLYSALDLRYLKLAGDNDPITSGITIQSTTATEEVLILKTTDDDTTKKLLDIVSSADASLVSVSASGNIDIVGHMALGADASLSTTTILGIDETLTTVNTTHYGIFAQLNLEPAGDLGAITTLVAMDMQAQYNSTVDASTYGYIHGIKGEAVNISEMVGAGGINELIGVYGKASNLGISNATSVIAGLFTAANDDGFGNETGDVASAYSLIARAYTDKGTGVITNRYGLYIEDTTGAGLLTNQYGLYIEDMASGSASGTTYAIYSLGGNVELTDGNITTTGIGTFGSVAIPTVFTVQTEPTGFVDKVATLSFNNDNYTFTITGNHDIYINGVKTTKTTASIAITDVTGLYWIYYDASGVLSQSTVAPGFGVPTIATVYWNTTTNKSLIGEERHGLKMDVDTHTLLHYTVGTRYESGLTGTFDDTTFTITAGVIDDEDLAVSISEQTTCNVLYKDGSANFKWLEAQTKYYYEDGSSDINYNNGNVLTPVGANLYVAYWIFATNDATTPIVSLMGQRTDTTVALARANNTYESLELGTLPFQEMKLLYRVILRNDATPYEEVLDLRSVSNLPAGTYIATAHNVLTGLTTGDDHTQYALLAGRSGGQTLIGSTVTAEDLTLKDNSVDNNTITVTQAIAAYTHSQIAGGNSVHVSTTENTNWDTAYSHTSLTNNPHSVTLAQVGGASAALDNLASVAINASLVPASDSAIDLGSSAPLYFANAYVDKVYLNSTASLDGSVAGDITVTGDLALGTAGNLLIGSGSAKIGAFGDTDERITFDCGGVPMQWNNCPEWYFPSGDAKIQFYSASDGTFTIANDYTGAGNLAVDDNISAGGNFLPKVDSASDLGSSTPKYFANAYIDKIYLDADSTIVNTDVDSWNAKIANVSEDTTPQLGGNLDLNDHQVTLKFEPGSDVTASGLIITATVDTNAEGIGAPLMMAADGHFDTANASASTTSPALVLALETGTGSKKVLVHGILRVDAWNWTTGPGKLSLIYLNTTVGTLTQTQPSATDQVVQPVGWALSDDCIYFAPSLFYFTHT